MHHKIVVDFKKGQSFPKAAKHLLLIAKMTSTGLKSAFVEDYFQQTNTFAAPLSIWNKELISLN